MRASRGDTRIAIPVSARAFKLTRKAVNRHSLLARCIELLGAAGLEFGTCRLRVAKSFWESSGVIQPVDPMTACVQVSAGAALYTFRQPGLYAYVNHNLIEALALGAAAHVRVEGQWNNDLMTQVVAPTALS